MTTAVATAPKRRDAVLIAVWLLVVLTGYLCLWKYKSTPGELGPAPHSWPAETRIERAGGRPTLVMFAHPMCPCSRASIDELAIIVSKSGGAVDAHVLFDKPASEGDDWTNTDLWRSARAIPGVSVSVDADGVEARRFGASTSGHVVLYDPAGHLLFAGGITNARGHEGDSEGRRAVLAYLRGGAATRTEAPVFGCSIGAPELDARR